MRSSPSISRRTVLYGGALIALGTSLFDPGATASAQESLPSTLLVDPLKGPPQGDAGKQLSEARNFWGLDLSAAFPEWKGTTILTSNIFESADGRLIARVGVGHGDGKKVSSWDVDLINKSKSPTPPDPHKPGYDLAPRNGLFRKIDDNMLSYQLTKTTRIALIALNPHGYIDSFCGDPVKDIYQIEEAYPLPSSPDVAWIPTKQQTAFVTKEHRVPAFQVGGSCGVTENDFPLKSMALFARGRGSPLFPLSDGTILIQVGFYPTYFVRMLRTLRTGFTAPGLLQINADVYVKLTGTQGPFKTQKQLLKLFN